MLFIDNQGLKIFNLFKNMYKIEIWPIYFLQFEINFTASKIACESFKPVRCIIYHF